ncbi:hypothetical protein DL767_009627 [Monosporascus sp. MG133]|nr:hypothetical protein DL767_009627 [Monosporascus sp. MG133]
MEDGFPEWREDFNPFDAIGFPAVGFQPPARDDFCKAVRYALFATHPERLRQAGAAAPKLPYSWKQVKLAVDFFTGVSQKGGDQQRQDGPDTVVWQWTFYDIIEFQCHSHYRRTWAPERRRWDNMILNPPVVNVVAAGEPATAQQGYHRNDAASSQLQQSQPQPQQPQQQPPQASPPPTQSSPALRRTSFGSATATAATSPDNDGSGKDNGNRQLLIPSPRDDDDGNDDNDNDNDGNDDDDDDVWEPPSATTMRPPKKGTEIHRSTGANAIRARPLEAGTFAAGKSILLGWHARQLDLAAENATADRDYRQAVFGTVTATGHIHIRLRVHNMLGQRVPPDYRLKGISSVPHKDIIYLPVFGGMPYDEIRREIGRQSLRQGGAQGATAWVPTPAAREGGGGGDVPARRRRGRPRGSKNRQ